VRFRLEHLPAEPHLAIAGRADANDLFVQPNPAARRRATTREARDRLYRNAMRGRSGQPRSSVALIATRYELMRELRVGTDTVDWEAFDSALERPVVIQLLRPDLAEDGRVAERFWAQARSMAKATPAVGERVLDAGADRESGQAFVVREWPAAPLSNARSARPRPRAPSLLTELVSRLPASPRWLAWGALALTLAVVGVGSRPGLERLLAWVNEPAQIAPGLGLLRDSRVPTRAPAATPAGSGQPSRVVNTDGRGVALRTAAGGDRLPGKGYDEGATVHAFEQSGAWTRIRGSDGREGWVLSVTLAP
jgi:hypothetical protein